MLGVIAAGVAAAASVYNGFAANQNADYAQGNLRKSKRLDNRMLRFNRGRVDQNYTQGLKDISMTASSTRASLAQGGNLGAGARVIADANALDSTTKLDDWKTSALKEIAFQQERSDMNYQSSLDEIAAQRFSGIFNAGAGVLGAGLQMGGSAVQSGWFDSFFKNPDGENLVGEELKKAKDSLTGGLK